MLAPINSNKHYVQRTNINVANGARIAVLLAAAVTAPATASTDQVRQGSVVKAMFVEFWILNDGTSGNDTQFNLVLEKAPSNAPGVVFADMANMQAYLNKKNVLFMSQGVISPQLDGATSIPIVRQWFKIPKGKQRMGLGDRVILSISSIGAAMKICGFSTYKEYE